VRHRLTVTLLGFGLLGFACGRTREGLGPDGGVLLGGEGGAGTGGMPPDGAGGGGGGGGTVQPAPLGDGGVTIGCSDLFDPSVLRSYSIDISADEWSKLSAEFANIQAVLAGMPMENPHPITFHLGSETVTDAVIRLKGQSSWVQTIMFDQPHPKMQFVVEFDTVNPNGKFHGVSHLVFDMPRTDWSFLNERMANTWLRELGILAPCANSGTLTINGNMYGLYVTEESKGGHLLKEFFPGNDQGDFLKGGELPDGMGVTKNPARKAQFWAAMDITAMSTIVDVPHSVLEWAAESVFNDGDGYYGGSHNFYIYDQGAAGFLFIPTDVDSTFGYMGLNSSVSYKQHPIFWWEGRSSIRPQDHGQHWIVAMNDPATRRMYIDAIATQLQHWDVSTMQSRLATWSQQIAGAVAADPNKWATTAQFQNAIKVTNDAISQRTTYLQSFLDCENGKGGADADGDGVRWCDDCRDNDATVHPGAPEICNGIDDNCNGLVDEGCPTAPPPTDAGAPPPPPAVDAGAPTPPPPPSPATDAAATGD